MSPEQQRIAIAEACGYKRGCFSTPFVGDAPNYLDDLNAMHAAEACLTTEQYNPAYIEHLRKICMDYEEMRAEPTEVLPVRIISATAAQRAEAFLRALGRWEADA